MDDKLNQVFKIMSFYDDCRWESSQNYNLINYFRNDLLPDIKILTHWLCYITDRQMPYQRIWDIGGFVFSELIYEIKKHKNPLTLLDPNNSNSFVKIIKQKDNSDDKFTFIGKSSADNNSVLVNYDKILENGKVKFKSRYLPSDYMSILYTFTILEDYDFNFSKFIKDIYLKHKDEVDFIKRILFSLCLLTYDGVGQPKSKDLFDFDANKEKAIQRKNRFKNILCDTNIFNNNYNIFLRHKVYEQKRAWCSLRDLIKSPEFKVYFEKALRQEGLKDEDFAKLFSYEALTQLELPGDVWNNNYKFRTCILKNTIHENSNQRLSIILREYYNNNRQHIIGYPEQFDITFDFVPKMCEQNNCDLCPIYKIEHKENNFDKICLKNENMYCPVTLVSCNYKNKCKGKNKCKLRYGNVVLKEVL